MTPAQAQAIAQDRERRRIEDRALSQVRYVLAQSLVNYTAAILGRSEGPASIPEATRLLVGGLVPTLQNAHVAATLQGRLRSLVVAKAQEVPIAIGSGGGGRGFGPPIIRGASGAGGGGRRPISVNELAADAIAQRLNLSPSQQAEIVARSGSLAITTSGELGNAALKRAEEIASDLVAKPLPTRQAVMYIREQMGALGITPAKPHAVETVYRTTVQIGYSAGRMRANEDPAIQEVLWGYQFSATMDDRTTEVCSSFDGMTRPKDDPIWLKAQPPLHYSCRSDLIEVFKEDQPAITDIPDVTIDPRFAIPWR